ncbi:restriction endonuclease [Marinobacterium mangrovicola]|uniref:Restriction system protein n=1 Tax=Marinobacterium mangrovicola TaxID=1476959 RepID=A0A4R1GS85_9GAMM|nr:restriction endonuclease [Marinobacterium mangrovicola]TCK07452.1 restriction system protein [Marinobacterium mangrovicola]
MKHGWMIRAGNGGRYFNDFKEANCVAIGWNNLGDLRQYTSNEALRDAYVEYFGNAKPGRTANAIAMIRKFRDDIQQGDLLITYSQEHREYLVGEDLGQYEFRPETEQVGEFQHIRKVKWLGRVSRDLFTQSTRNSMGSVLTVFSLSGTVIDEVQDRLAGKPAQTPSLTDDIPTVEAEFELLREEVVSRGHELIKDKIQALDPEEMEELTAALLRAMGYQTRVSARGPDRGVDVLASPDGLGLTEPRIKAEVKHRNGSMGSNPIRSFIGALREGDRGLFISTGGFTREARYEAERATIPVTLIDIDLLADLVVANYEKFDIEGQRLLPLVKVYWPAE